MNQRTRRIREVASGLLASGTVQGVLGYRQGSVPLRAQPVLARTVEEAGTLIWNSFCGGNLAKLLIGRMKEGERLAVVAQGCVSRNINLLVQENQLARDSVYVIGVPCIGMLDRRKIEARAPGHVLEVREELDDAPHIPDSQGKPEARGAASAPDARTVSTGKGADLTHIDVRVMGADGLRAEMRLLRRDVKRENCYTCLHRNPVGADVVVAEPVEEEAGGNIDFVAVPWARLADPEARARRMEETFRSCIRCYACRDACPLCYCRSCFTDDTDPAWCGRTLDRADVHTFHLLRAFHCAGRCTDCGACETACPQGIRMRRLTSMLEHGVRQRWAHQPGMDAETPPPLAVFRPDDKEGGFR